MIDILKLSEQTQQEASDVLNKTQAIEIWQSIGATVNLVGSYPLGLMMKHRDIDMHIYSEPLTLDCSLDAINKIAANPLIKRIEYVNLLNEIDACIEWHAWYEDEKGETWQIDMMHILKGSRFDGFFEKVRDRIKAVLTDESKKMILQLKYETPDDEKISGIEYYRAVIEGNVRSFSKFMKWREENPLFGISEWMP